MKKGIVICLIITITTLLSGCVSEVQQSDASLDREIIYITSPPVEKSSESKIISITPQPTIKPVTK